MQLRVEGEGGVGAGGGARPGDESRGVTTRVALPAPWDSILEIEAPHVHRPVAEPLLTASALTDRQLRPGIIATP